MVETLCGAGCVASGKKRFSVGRTDRRQGCGSDVLRTDFPNVISSLTIPNVIQLEEAQQRILKVLPSPTIVRVAVANGAGRFLAENIAAAVDLPPFENSAMDGYAVRAADVAGA